MINVRSDYGPINVGIKTKTQVAGPDPEGRAPPGSGLHLSLVVRYRSTCLLKVSSETSESRVTVEISSSETCQTNAISRRASCASILW